jgi:hypothetical protein
VSSYIFLYWDIYNNLHNTLFEMYAKYSDYALPAVAQPLHQSTLKPPFIASQFYDFHI